MIAKSAVGTEAHLTTRRSRERESLYASFDSLVGSRDSETKLSGCLVSQSPTRRMYGNDTRGDQSSRSGRACLAVSRSVGRVGWLMSSGTERAGLID